MKIIIIHKGEYNHNRLFSSHGNVDIHILTRKSINSRNENSYAYATKHENVCES